ncbi:GDSL-type esterase/lipase family protein [Zhouia sp. PK063]|uniref:SGNH/GDSL hydrolase family protein n=1 Tax=Zhouia sp. PK063 TaxID=3373602 RepID=UPI0037B5BCBC
MKKISYALFATMSLMACSPKPPKAQLFLPSDAAHFAISGRTDLKDSTLVLISAASKIAFTPESKDTVIAMFKNDQAQNHSFIALAINKQYQKRIRIDSDTINHIAIPLSKTDTLVELYKATEASTGNVLFAGVKTKSLATAPKKPSTKIEFVGNSITSGFGNDHKEYPCGSAGWFDAHNAFFSYATLSANELNADFVLSSVSGWGMYRNWDVNGPTIPDVYDNLYLNTDSTKHYTAANFKPELVSICLGTNDLSGGDGVHERLPFSKEDFTTAYIKFVAHVIATRNNPKIAILDSPMVSGENKAILDECLTSVANYFKAKGKVIHVFNFDRIPETGCGGHPAIKEDMMMAKQLEPFLQNILKGKE